MTHVPTFVEIQAVLRQIRLHHWKEASKYRYAANLNEVDETPYIELANTHMRYVQTLNEFFPIHETAERDANEGELFE